MSHTAGMMDPYEIQFDYEEHPGSGPTLIADPRPLNVQRAVGDDPFEKNMSIFLHFLKDDDHSLRLNENIDRNRDRFLQTIVVLAQFHVKKLVNETTRAVWIEMLVAMIRPSQALKDDTRAWQLWATSLRAATTLPAEAIQLFYAQMMLYIFGPHPSVKEGTKETQLEFYIEEAKSMYPKKLIKDICSAARGFYDTGYHDFPPDESVAIFRQSLESTADSDVNGLLRRLIAQRILDQVFTFRSTAVTAKNERLIEMVKHQTGTLVEWVEQGMLEEKTVTVLEEEGVTVPEEGAVTMAKSEEDAIPPPTIVVSNADEDVLSPMTSNLGISGSDLAEQNTN